MGHRPCWYGQSRGEILVRWVMKESDIVSIPPSSWNFSWVPCCVKSIQGFPHAPVEESEDSRECWLSCASGCVDWGNGLCQFTKDLCFPELERGWRLIHTSRGLYVITVCQCRSLVRQERCRKKMANLLRTKYHELTLLISIKISYNSGGCSGNRGKSRQKVSLWHWPWK